MRYTKMKVKIQNSNPKSARPAKPNTAGPVLDRNLPRVGGNDTSLNGAQVIATGFNSNGKSVLPK